MHIHMWFILCTWQPWTDHSKAKSKSKMIKYILHCCTKCKYLSKITTFHGLISTSAKQQVLPKFVKPLGAGPVVCVPFCRFRLRFQIDGIMMSWCSIIVPYYKLLTLKNPRETIPKRPSDDEFFGVALRVLQVKISSALFISRRCFSISRRYELCLVKLQGMGEFVYVYGKKVKRSIYDICVYLYTI